MGLRLLPSLAAIRRAGKALPLKTPSLPRILSSLRAQSGMSAVEFALVLPAFLVLLIEGVQIGLYF